MAASNGHGGRRPGAGRPKGSENKTTLAREAGLPDAVAAARAYAVAAWRALAEVMEDRKAPAAARVKAAGEILNRAYGRPPALAVQSRVETAAEKAERRASPSCIALNARAAVPQCCSGCFRELTRQVSGPQW